MKKKKKIESIASFMARRNKKKEDGKVVIPETKVSPSLAAGSHKLKAIQMSVGVTKPKTRMMLERTEKKKKKRRLHEALM